MSDVAQGAQVGLIMGSDSDWPTMEAAAEALAEFGIRFEVGVVSAHRTPQRMLDYAKSAAGRGIKVIIARIRRMKAPAVMRQSNGVV